MSRLFAMATRKIIETTSIATNVGSWSIMCFLGFALLDPRPAPWENALWPHLLLKQIPESPYMWDLRCRQQVSSGGHQIWVLRYSIMISRSKWYLKMWRRIVPLQNFGPLANGEVVNYPVTRDRICIFLNSRNGSKNWWMSYTPLRQLEQNKSLVDIIKDLRNNPKITDDRLL